jgi:hypothetical protein
MTGGTCTSIRRTAFGVSACAAHGSRRNAVIASAAASKSVDALTVTLCVMPSTSATDTRHVRGATLHDTMRFRVLFATHVGQNKQLND